MNALDVARYGHMTLLSTLDALLEPLWEEPGACGRWSVKAIVAHLASYEAVLVDLLGELIDGRPAPALERFLALGAAFNDAEVDARRALTPEETRRELDTLHARALDLLAVIPPKRLRQPGLLPWYGAGYAPDDLLVYQYYGHKREHAAQIAVARDRFAALAGAVGYASASASAAAASART